MKGLAALLILGPTFSPPAFAAPADIGIITPQGESLDSASAGRIRQDLSDERDRLLVKLKANSPDQKPNSMTTSVSELVGVEIAGAIRHALVVQPHGQPVLIGIDPQTSSNGNRQLVLLNISAWIRHGRVLGANSSEAFAILPDPDMQKPAGSAFQVDGVRYLGRVVSGSIVFQRTP